MIYHLNHILGGRVKRLSTGYRYPGRDREVAPSQRGVLGQPLYNLLDTTEDPQYLCKFKVARIEAGTGPKRRFPSLY